MGGILFGAIAGGLAGAGQAGVSALAELQKYEQNKTLEEMRAELMYQKQKKLSELSHKQNVELEGNRQKAASEENVKERNFRAEQAKGEQEFRVEQFGTELLYRYDLQGRELSAQAANSEADRKSREKVAGMQVRAEQLRAEKPALQQLSDGTFAWMDPKTKKAEKVVDAETGEEVRGKTDMTASQLASIGSLKAWAEKVIGRETSTAEERKAATHTLTVQIPRMLSDKGGPTPTAAAFTELAKGLTSTDPSVRATVSAEWDKAWKKNGYPIGAAIEHLKTEQVVPPKSGAVDPKKVDPKKVDPKKVDPKKVDQPGVVQGAMLSSKTEALGTELDLARQTVATAETNLQRFGMKQQRDDPQGFSKARADARAAQERLSVLRKEYEAAASLEVGLNWK